MIVEETRFYPLVGEVYKISVVNKLLFIKFNAYSNIDWKKEWQENFCHLLVSSAYKNQQILVNRKWRSYPIFLVSVTVYNWIGENGVRVSVFVNFQRWLTQDNDKNKKFKVLREPEDGCQRYVELVWVRESYAMLHMLCYASTRSLVH